MNLIRIAYAEDHALVRKAICDCISNFRGCSIAFEAPNGYELIKKLEKAKDLPDICILDVSMPVMNGFETLVQIRKQWEGAIKILMLTAYGSDHSLIQTIRAGANGYLEKACEPKELEMAIQSIYKNDTFSCEKLDHNLFRAIKNHAVDMPSLTDNEISLLKFCCSDLSYKQIADEMNTTMHCVDWYRNSLFKKLSVKSRSSLVMFAIKLGLANLENWYIDKQRSK